MRPLLTAPGLGGQGELLGGLLASGQEGSAAAGVEGDALAPSRN